MSPEFSWITVTEVYLEDFFEPLILMYFIQNVCYCIAIIEYHKYLKLYLVCDSTV